MTYEMYRSVFLISLIACGVMAVVSVLLFFVLQIPKVVGDLSGSTAKKAIQDIRKQTEGGGERRYQSKQPAQGQSTGNPPKTYTAPAAAPPTGTTGITERISQQQEPAAHGGEETTLLSQDSMETVPLSPENDGQFAIEYEITYIHSNEVIPREAR